MSLWWLLLYQCCKINQCCYSYCMCFHENRLDVVLWIYSVALMVFLFQSGLPVMSLDILSQFPTPPVPNLPAMAMAMPAVLTHQQPIMPPATPAVMPIASSTLAQPSNSFIANFPPVQVTCWTHSHLWCKNDHVSNYSDVQLHFQTCFLSYPSRKPQQVLE